MYYIYKTTNKINGKYYIGVHKSDNIVKSNYLGSGTALKKAIRKYGKENFIREILYSFKDITSAYLKESEIITREFINSPNTYNSKLGGIGGFDFINKHKLGGWNSLTDEQKLNFKKSASKRMQLNNPGKLKHVRELSSKRAKERFTLDNPNKKKENRKKLSIRMSKCNPMKDPIIQQKVRLPRFLWICPECLKQILLPEKKMKNRIGCSVSCSNKIRAKK